MKVSLPPQLKFYKLSGRPTLEPILKSALQIQENIPSLDQIETDGRFWIKASLISPNPLQAENFSEDTIYIQGTGAVLEFMSEEFQEKLLSRQVTYITGPAGMGKSYAMLFYILVHRKINDCAILYINNPIELLQNSCHYILKEVIYAIAGDLTTNVNDIACNVFDLKGGESDEEAQKAIFERFSRIFESNNFKDLREIIIHLQTFYAQRDKAFMVIFDQYTRYQEESQKYPFASRCVEKLLNLFTMKIFGRSCLQLKVTQNELWLGSKFEAWEAKIFLANRLLNTSLGKLMAEALEEKTDDEHYENCKKVFSKIQETTELIPLELGILVSLALENPNDAVEKLSDRYYSKRVPVIGQIHAKWINKLSNYQCKRIEEFIFALDNSLAQGKGSLASLITQPDPNLIYYDKETEQWCYISRLVRNAVYQYHISANKYIEFIAGNLHRYMKDILNVMRDESTSERTKDLFERFIEYTIRIAMYRLEDYQIQYYSRTNPQNIIKLPLKSTILKKFNSEDLESQIVGVLKDKDIGVLSPINPDFAYVDFIMVDARNAVKRIIYLLKTAVNVKSHEKSDVFYRNEINNLILGKNKTGNELISEVMFKITTENNYVETEFIWISGDDLWAEGDVDPGYLLQGKQENSGIALIRNNLQMSRYLS